MKMSQTRNTAMQRQVKMRFLKSDRGMIAERFWRSSRLACKTKTGSKKTPIISIASEACLIMLEPPAANPLRT